MDFLSWVGLFRFQSYFLFFALMRELWRRGEKPHGLSVMGGTFQAPVLFQLSDFSHKAIKTALTPFKIQGRRRGSHALCTKMAFTVTKLLQAVYPSLSFRFSVQKPPLVTPLLSIHTRSHVNCQHAVFRVVTDPFACIITSANRHLWL